MTLLIGSTLTFPIALTAAEGDALGVLDALCCIVRPEGVCAAAIGSVRPELLIAGASRIRVAVLRFLVEEGGYRQRQVLRDGRRVLGRVWASELGAGLRLRYTDATSQLWLGAARSLPKLVQSSLRGAAEQSSEGAKRHKRALRDMVLTANTDTGDWVFYAMVHRSLGGFGLGADDYQQVTRRLRQGSALAALMELDAEGTEPEIRGRFRRLCEMPTARVIECLEDRIAAGWVAVVTEVFRRYASVESRTARWGTVATVLVAWVGAIDNARRMDLARPVLKLFSSLVTGIFSKGGDSVRAELSSVGWLKNVKERDDLVASVASVLAVAQDLFRRREVLAMEGYGDDRYDEAQIYLRDVTELMAPSRRAIEGLCRALSSTVG